MPRLTDLTATDAIAAMRAGEIAAEDYARALLDQADRLAALNAFRTLDREAVLEAARAADVARSSGAKLGVLHGLPIPVKDSVNTKALPTSNGTRTLCDFRPRTTRACSSSWRKGDRHGKDQPPRASRGWTSNNGAFGAVRIPTTSSASRGSSGGSSCAVAARIAPRAIAEDTWGSIRVPASMCGLAGLRPTYGRYSGAGIMPLTLGKFDTAGPLARSVADLTLFDSIASGDARPIPEGSLQGARIGVCTWLWSGPRLRGRAGRPRKPCAALRTPARSWCSPTCPTRAREGLGIAPVIIGYENVASISAFLLEEGTGVGFGELLRRQAPTSARCTNRCRPATPTRPRSSGASACRRRSGRTSRRRASRRSRSPPSSPPRRRSATTPRSRSAARACRSARSSAATRRSAIARASRAGPSRPDSPRRVAGGSGDRRADRETTGACCPWGFSRSNARSARSPPPPAPP